ncbi:MAG: RNA polymerase sigma factor [Gemmataceae bacterium]
MQAASQPAEPVPLTPAQEARWIREAQAGQREAFGRLVEAYWPRLYRWLFQLTQNRHAAEDLAQDAILRAWEHVRRFQPGTNFRAWLFRIAHNALLNSKRSPANRRLQLPTDLTDPEPRPDQTLLGRELLQRLGHALAALPADWRAALLLRAEEGLSFRQIAEITETTEETARWRVYKARQQLLATMDPQPPESS